MRMQELMSREVETVGGRTTVKAARETMRRKRIGHLIVTEGRQVVGVLSRRDTERAWSQPDDSVSDHMTSPAVTAESDTTVREAANKMRGRGIGCLPILENGKLTGIVTITDLLEMLGKGVLKPSPIGERPILRDRGPRRRPPAAR
jgi:acetoin utilization protein AcuB